MKKKKYSEEERKAAHKEAANRWREKNKEKIKEKVKEYQKEWRKTHPDYQKQWKDKNPEYFEEWRKNNPDYSTEYMKNYSKTKYGRASCLCDSYKRADKNAGREKCTLTPQWIVENIFSQSCTHCKETDWHKLGCNRLDNSLPHTPDNVEPCCYHCNVSLAFKERVRDDITGRFLS